jgi:hypothetical protein
MNATRATIQSRIELAMSARRTFVFSKRLMRDQKPSAITRGQRNSTGSRNVSSALSCPIRRIAITTTMANWTKRNMHNPTLNNVLNRPNKPHSCPPVGSSTSECIIDVAPSGSIRDVAFKAYVGNRTVDEFDSSKYQVPKDTCSYANCSRDATASTCCYDACAPRSPYHRRSEPSPAEVFV